MTFSSYGDGDFPRVRQEWPRGDRAARMFADIDWLAAFKDRIEGEHVWYLADRGTGRVALMGTVLTGDIPSEAKNPRRLFTEPCASLRSQRRLDGIRAALDGAPPPQRWFPALVLVYPGFECFPARRGPVDAALLAELVDGVLRDARRRGCRSVAFLYVPAAEVDFATAVERAGPRPFYNASVSTLTLPGTGYEDYLGMLSRRQRADARKCEAALASLDVSYVERPLAPDLFAPLTVLRLEDRRKHGRRLDAGQERSLFETLHHRFPDRTWVTMAYREGAAQGFSLYLETEPGTEHAWTQGIRNDVPHPLQHYLSCTYYRPIRGAYRRGTRSINYGYGTDRLKRLRGCAEEEMTGYFHSFEPSVRDYTNRLIDRALRPGADR